MDVKKGCLYAGIAAVLVFALLAGFCAYRIRGIASEDIPSANAVTAQFIERFNAGDQAGLYALCSTGYAAKVDAAACAERVARIRAMTGRIVLGEQQGWNARDVNADRYLEIHYAATGDTGAVRLQMQFHEQRGWKVAGFEVAIP